jgi:protein TonB
MFDAVVHGQEVPTRRIGAGVVLSIVAHVALVAIVLYYSAHHVRVKEKATDVVFKAAMAPPPPPPPPPPAGGGPSKPKTEQAKKPVPVKKPDTLVESKQKEEEKPKETEKPAEPEKATDGPGEPGGQPGGVPGGVDGGVVGGQLGGQLGGVLGGQLGGTGTVPTNITLPFGEGMTPPSLVAGQAQPTYSREALEAKVEGKVIARCTITVTGTLTDCRIIKGLPHLDQVVLTALAGQKYSPVMYQGHAQSVFYTLTFRFKLP